MIRLLLLSTLIGAAAADFIPPGLLVPRNCTEPNEQYYQYGPCDKSCRNKDSMKCTLELSFNVCDCKEGFYRSASGLCVTAQQCDAELARVDAIPVCNRTNERVGGNPPACHQTCKRGMNAKQPGICLTKIGVAPNCECNEGFYRNDNGDCVRYGQCPPPVCTRANEKVSISHPSCWRTCEKGNRPQLCPMIAMRPGTCQCKEGFYRAKSGECVTYEQCSPPPPTTPAPPQDPRCKKKNEGFRECSSCEPKCGQFKGLFCDKACHGAKCQCRSGFYRNAKGDCISREECEKEATKITCATARHLCKGLCRDSDAGPVCYPSQVEYIDKAANV